MHPTLSAIVPIHGDAAALAELTHRLRATFARLRCTYEIIFVNDASPDDAQARLERMAHGDRRIKVITHSRAFGTQAAFASGLDAARGAACVLLDGDLQDPPEVIETFYARWRAGFDVVVGVRTRRDMPWLHELPYKLFYRIWQRLASIPIALDAGEFALLDRRVVRALQALPERERFLRGLRAWVGFRQVGVPYVRPLRPYGRSTNTWLSNLRTARLGIVSFTGLPLGWLGALGLMMAVGGGIQALRQGAHGVALLLAGVQLLGLAVVGEYVARALAEVKGRPPYIVAGQINLDTGPSACQRCSPSPRAGRYPGPRALDPRPPAGPSSLVAP